MRVTRLLVENHSRLADLEIKVREHLVLVGPNDVGKSSVLRCLDLLLGATTAQIYSSITPEDIRDPNHPLVIETELQEFTPDEEALFPDEITVDPASGVKSLTLRLTAMLDTTLTLTVERIAPGGGTGRQISRAQLTGLGWKMLGATAIARDLRTARKSPLDDIIASIDLGVEKDDFDAIVAKFEETLTSSKSLADLRSNLATHLSKALPQPVTMDQLAFVAGATKDDNPLSDTRLQISRDGRVRNLDEQSDGTRALFALALYEMISIGANMVAIDEPEIHLHPTSQRSLAKLLQGTNQKFIATHSADIVGAFDPECIAAVRVGGHVVQASTDFLTDDERMSVRWWVRDKLEPLTSRRVIAVEGISDRIILERCANVTDRNLDRLGCAIIETNGSGDMGAIIKLFGESGFNIPMSLLIDEDATSYTAEKLGVPEYDLHQHSTWVCRRDLEEEYVSALGGSKVWEALLSSSMFTNNELSNCIATGNQGERTEYDIASFCRKKSQYKVRAALAVAPLIDERTAREITGVEALLKEAEGS